MLINFETGFITPPFGMLLFVIKGVAPELSIKEICSAAAPFILIEIVAMGVIVVWPQIVLWLPRLVD